MWKVGFVCVHLHIYWFFVTFAFLRKLQAQLPLLFNFEFINHQQTVATYYQSVPGELRMSWCHSRRPKTSFCQHTASVREGRFIYLKIYTLSLSHMILSFRINSYLLMYYDGYIFYKPFLWWSKKIKFHHVVPDFAATLGCDQWKVEPAVSVSRLRIAFSTHITGLSKESVWTTGV